MSLRTGSAFFFVATYCFVHSFHKDKFCRVPSGAIIKVGCDVCKKKGCRTLAQMTANDESRAGEGCRGLFKSDSYVITHCFNWVGCSL